MCMKNGPFKRIVEEYVGNFYSFVVKYYYDRSGITVLNRTHDGVDNTLVFKVVGGNIHKGVREVEIKTHGYLVEEAKCTCSEYLARKRCEHIAACLYYYPEELFHMDDKEKSLLLTKDLLDSFDNNENITKKRVHKLARIEVELEFNYSKNTVDLSLKIGENNFYYLNSKLGAFLKAYMNQTTYNFGKNFSYDPKVHYFSDVDEELLNFLLTGDFTSKDVTLNNRTMRGLLQILKKKKFTIKDRGSVTAIKYENPLDVTLDKAEDCYRLSIENREFEGLLLKSNEFLYKNHTLYILPSNLASILSTMVEYEMTSLYFKPEDMETFKKTILPIVKRNCLVASNLQDEIQIGNKPIPRIYIDFKDVLFISLKFDYDGIVVDYFDKETNLIRDEDTEKICLEDILSYNFLLDDNLIYMDDFEEIGYFLDCRLEMLAEKYEVFSSVKIKNTKIYKDMRITSSFSIGKDNIMNYSFDLGDIDPDEIVNILGEMKKHRKYYRLRSGDFINLDESDELIEFSSLVDDLELSDKDIKLCSGEIPKYRAIYLDAVKKDKYHIIKTDNLFDELISKFEAYKDTDAYISKGDKKTLRDYQEIGVKWLYNIYKCGFGGILADEMGLGKSIQLICFIKAILKEKPDAKVLIVSPTSLVYNWASEFDKFAPTLNYKVFAENKEVRKEKLEHISDTNVLITTYGLIRRDEDLYKDIDFEVIAIDEAQNIKNVHAQMTKAVKTLNAKIKFALTGTPLENSVLELWSIFDFLMPGYLANIASFQKKYNIKDVDKDNLSKLDTLETQIRPFILRRKKKDVIKELPDKIENNIYIDLEPEQKKLYLAELEKTTKEFDELVKMEGFTKSSFKILQLLTKLRELCVDPRLLYENYRGSSAKIENLISITKGIIKNGHKILLFSSYKKAIDLVNLEFTNNNISTYVIDGSVPAKKRIELVDKFNSDETNVFLITLKSGGTGLNLTSADVVVHLDLWWNPQVEDQATDRAHRIGQKNTVEVIKLISKGTIEERILELQNKKRILSDKLIEGENRDENIISKLTEKDIRMLLSLDNKED